MLEIIAFRLLLPWRVRHVVHVVYACEMEPLRIKKMHRRRPSIQYQKSDTLHGFHRNGMIVVEFNCRWKFGTMHSRITLKT